MREIDSEITARAGDIETPAWVTNPPPQGDPDAAHIAIRIERDETGGDVMLWSNCDDLGELYDTLVNAAEAIRRVVMSGGPEQVGGESDGQDR